jgi:hypothetical protein
VMGRGIALYKKVSPRYSVFASVFVTELLDRLDADAGRFKTRDGYADVDDGLGYHSGDGCAPHVLDIEYVLADRSLQAGLLFLKESFPLGIVWFNSDNASFQANHYSVLWFSFRFPGDEHQDLVLRRRLRISKVAFQSGLFKTGLLQHHEQFVLEVVVRL